MLFLWYGFLAKVKIEVIGFITLHILVFTRSIAGLPPQQTGKIVQIEEAEPKDEVEASPLPPERKDNRGEKPLGEKTLRRGR